MWTVCIWNSLSRLNSATWPSVVLGNKCLWKYHVITGWTQAGRGWASDQAFSLLSSYELAGSFPACSSAQPRIPAFPKLLLASETRLLKPHWADLRRCHRGGGVRARLHGWGQAPQSKDTKLWGQLSDGGSCWTAEETKSGFMGSRKKSLISLYELSKMFMTFLYECPMLLTFHLPSSSIPFPSCS